MFELLSSIESLTKETKRKSHIMSSLEIETNERKINLSHLMILGKTYREWGKNSQETYLGIINDYCFFYLEVVDTHCKSIVINKNIEVVFDLFYSREIIKSDKNHNIKEIKCMLLYKKLYEKMTSKSREKLKKI